MNAFEDYTRVRKNIPEHVKLVVAAKSRTPVEVLETINAGAKHIGENYVQEAEKMKKALGKLPDTVSWHMIGHLQRNKVKRALKVFNVIQTIDSIKLAEKVNCLAQKPVSVYIQVNVGPELSKYGFDCSQVIHSIKDMDGMNNLIIEGLMTIEPISKNTQAYFKKMKRLFDEIKSSYNNMKFLSMGMSNTYDMAVKEGSNVVRVGTAIFGHR